MARPVSLLGLPIYDTYPHDVARGIVPGTRPFSAYGEITTTGADSGVLWPSGAYSFPDVAGIQLAVVSDDAVDAAAGTGLRTVAIHGLDVDLNEVVEIVTLNGTTPVSTVRTDWRFVQCTHAVTWGSGKVAAGNISVTNVAGTAAYSYIAAGAVRCSSSVRMVPAGKRLIVDTFYGGSASGSAAAVSVIRIATPSFEGYDFTAEGVFVPLAAATYQDGSGGLGITCPLAFTEGQVLGMTFQADKAATVAGSWFGWLEDA